MNIKTSVTVVTFVNLLAASLVIFVPLHAQENGANKQMRWWKGNLHTHSFWSDGTDFPEMIARWYQQRDYNFLALSDHNILSRGERWMAWKEIKNRTGGEAVLKKYKDAFGSEWVETRENDQGELEIRLRPLDEFRSKVEANNQFIMIEGEEISDSVARLPVHLNATNLQELLPPVGGATVREAIDNNLRAAEEQAQKTGKEILVHLNHPNFGWAVTAEDIAWTTRERFIEVYNGHPSVNHLGDTTRPSIERMWDIVNTIRIDQLDAPPVFGLGTDDSHEYHGRPNKSHPGRAWVMVRASRLDATSLIKAMYRGDFYASSGIVLSDVRFDREKKELMVSIVPEEGVTYETKFIGTRRNYDKSTKPQTDEQGQPVRATKIYSADIGQVLATSDAHTANYELTGDELYVRAVITSSKVHPNPSFKDQFEQAWTQPVGWRKR